MAERSDEIRHEIEQTRERMGETVDALGHKADVPGRAREWASEKKEAVVSRVAGATPDPEAIRHRGRRARQTAERNPFGLAVGGAAIGFLAGLFMPSTRAEDERIGPMADQVKSTAAEAGREALERGKQVAQETTEAAMETAREKGREQGEELSSSLQEKAKEVAPQQPETRPS
jgi:gas vesicle protein